MSGYIPYAAFARALARGDVDVASVRQTVILVTDDYEPDLELDHTIADIRHAEVEPSGSYRAGGQQLTLHPSGRGYNPAKWTSFTGSFRYAVFADLDTGGLIHYLDLGHQEYTGVTVAIEGADVEPAEPPIASVDDLLATLL